MHVAQLGRSETECLELTRGTCRPASQKKPQGRWQVAIRKPRTVLLELRPASLTLGHPCTPAGLMVGKVT